MIALDFVTIIYMGAIGLTVIGALGLALCNHCFRLLLALVLTEAGINLLLVLAGYRAHARTPILGFGPEGAPMVDPIPQALVLTAIVIGVGIQALTIALLVRVFRAYGTLDIRELKRRFEYEVAVEKGIDARGPKGPSTPYDPRPMETLS